MNAQEFPEHRYNSDILLIDWCDKIIYETERQATSVAVLERVI